MRTAFQRISPQHASDLILRARAGIKPLALFDSRDAASYQKSHIIGTDHLTEHDFGEVIANLPKSVPVMIYCYHGNASQVYASMFADFQYNEVYSVDGGYEALVPALSETPKLHSQSSVTLTEFIEEHQFDAEDLNSPWHHALTPLMRAALFGNESLVTELLALGVNIHMRNLDGNNALWLACVSGNLAIIKLFLEAGIDIDNRNVTGATTLMYTASSGKHELTKLLLDHGADPFIRNDDDYLAIELAASEECLKLLRHTAS
ncbi:MAG: ankyrin repeat domain-containing protein [Methylotenera sp.]|uniref:ankyrin repeat domain-containing protein n=1 Tax=Methylotenera sp. TaxID=2051956 RepID=UPI002486E5D9|nr:ankyrin repeat domain-containing protein [Methylotenera sp.]MDI1310415.1 ankyrin repeat domain-containing protein [Methylotenera sp.]